MKNFISLVSLIILFTAFASAQVTPVVDIPLNVTDGKQNFQSVKKMILMK